MSSGSPDYKEKPFDEEAQHHTVPMTAGSPEKRHTVLSATTTLHDYEEFPQSGKVSSSDNLEKAGSQGDEKPSPFRNDGKLDSSWEVKFDENDPENPKNWSRGYRWYITCIAGLLVFNATFASTAPSGIVEQLGEQFKISDEVITLIISLFIFGYCVGPLFWGPLSERFGRKPVFVASFIGYTCFQVGCSLAPNTGSILVFRFLAGCFAASPLANSGALIGDIWDVDTRGKALAIFTLAPFAGPAVGPTVSGFMAVSGVHWRWVFWVLTIFAGSCLAVIFFTIKETYAPKILEVKARRLRKETGEERWYAPTEKHVQTSKPSIGKKVHDTLGKPFIMLFQEPMLAAITIYMSFVYGCLYLEFEAYPIVFTEDHGITNQGLAGLMFLPIFVGGVLAVITILVYYNPQYQRWIKEYAPNPVPPEKRLGMAVIAGPVFAISFFWFGWTSYARISFWAPMMSGIAFGWALCLIFQSLFNYLIDTYLAESASALSITTVVRSIFGASFPLFATQMFNAMNPRWASTLLGCVALLMVPIPLVFIKYGPTLRARSKFSPTEFDE